MVVFVQNNVNASVFLLHLWSFYLHHHWIVYAMDNHSVNLITLTISSYQNDYNVNIWKFYRKHVTSMPSSQAVEQTLMIETRVC